MLKEAKEDFTRGLEDVSSSKQVKRLRQDAEDAYDYASDGINKAKNATSDLIKENPLVAVCTGFVAGTLFAGIIALCYKK